MEQVLNLISTKFKKNSQMLFFFTNFSPKMSMLICNIFSKKRHSFPYKSTFSVPLQDTEKLSRIVIRPAFEIYFGGQKTLFPRNGQNNDSGLIQGDPASIFYVNAIKRSCTQVNATISLNSATKNIQHGYETTCK